MECREEEEHLACINFCWGVEKRKEEAMKKKRR